MAYLKIKNFKKAYGDKIIFEGINFSAKKGEFMTLLCPSGCGKSTLLRCIAGLSQINGGKISLNDKDLTKLSLQKKKYRYGFSKLRSFPNLNVFENVAFGLKIKKMDKNDIEKRVKKC
ncbi:ATP-binding cassette domain-containing protein [Campylobacter jejuni]|nr:MULTISPECIES: ATP-binding cassette domain-containing protein [Campylobacter]KAJ9715138.1 ATP-binding cassette domain-containing protein [Campylobacter jejuni]KAJ9876125.1 ATP-binding cassette domain-containing protein [Campylobacter jejuni]KAJ9901077.1 ATP-binding cassette domain-containing protein [Campylobacter jejuni]